MKFQILFVTYICVGTKEAQNMNKLIDQISL